MTVATQSDSTPAVPPSQLDMIADLVRQEEEASRAVTAWQKKRDQLREAIATYMGESTSGTLDGEEIVTYDWVDQFREADFRKEYPQIHRAYLTEQVKMVLDRDLLRRAQPELFRQFQTRKLINKWKPEQGVQQ